MHLCPATQRQDMLKPHLEQNFSNWEFLTYWAKRFFVVRSCLVQERMLSAASLASADCVAVAQKCLQTLQNVLWMTKLHILRSAALALENQKGRSQLRPWRMTQLCRRLMPRTLTLRELPRGMHLTSPLCTRNSVSRSLYRRATLYLKCVRDTFKK